MLARTLPFVSYLLFLGLGAGLQWLYPDRARNLALWLYPLRIAVAMGLLLYFRQAYVELKERPLLGWKEASWVAATGILVYVAWVRMDWEWAVQSRSAGYNPFEGTGSAGWVLAAIRLFGAAAAVPFLEELFWRSFLIRYTISANFMTIPLGTFTWGSFLTTIILFGLEHDLWLAGIMAGVSYNLLLYVTHRLWPCILAHALTNLLLGIHVLATGEWQWW